MFKKKKKKNDVQEEMIEPINEENNKEIKEEKVTSKKSIDDVNISVYKWLKVVQSIVLFALGLILLFTSIYTKEESSGAILGLGYSIGSILTIYGLINILAGYLLFRSPFGQSQDIPSGVLSLCFAIAFFFNPTIIETILPYIIMTALIAYFVLLFIYGLDLLLWKGKRKTFKAILAFTLSILLLALAITYIILWNNSNTKFEIQKCITIILGIILMVLGILSLISTIKKVKNTEDLINEQQEIKLKKTDDAKKNKVKIYRKQDDTNENKENEENVILIEQADDKKQIEDKK